jgi:beta-galactosidase GanA
MKTENNKLIAEFLGYTKPHPEFKSSTYWYKEGQPPLAILLFDTDWNWLMEVVEKIEGVDTNLMFEIKSHFNPFINKRLHNVVIINGEDFSVVCGSTLIESKIEATYKACVEFVKWYNNQKQGI